MPVNHPDDIGVFYAPAHATKDTIAFEGVEYTRTNSLPWPGNTYIIYLLQEDEVFGVTGNDSDGNPIDCCRWKIIFGDITAFFCLYNEKTGIYLRLLEGTMYAPNKDSRMASSFLPVRHPSGVYLPRWFRNVHHHQIGASADVEAMQGGRWEFIRV